MDIVSFEGDDGDRINAKLYDALSRGEDVKVFEMCPELRKGPFHILTIHHDTLIHMATFCKRNNLVVALLRSLPETQFENLTWTNTSGNTILHETSTNNKTCKAAAEMLRRAPSLLTMTNNGGETPLFRAARHGKTSIFKFLNGEVRKAIQKGVDMETFLLRNDKATILHASILSHNFDLAILIAKTYPLLVEQEDGDGLTALQLLACSPSAFDDGVGSSHFKRLIYSYIGSSLEQTSGVPMLHEIRMNKHRCESAKELARILIENDKSWKKTESRSSQGRAKFHKFTGNTTSVTDRGDAAIVPSTPLLLATKYGCIEIVEEILKVYPQAVEHIDDEGRNILHLAIKYRRKEIIKLVIDMVHPVRILRGKIDKEGNSLLHMVGVKAKKLRGEDDIRSPAFVLRDDLILYEQVRKECTTLARLQINSNKLTADQLLLKSNATLRVDAKEWMKSTVENCSIVAVLIATVAFAAAYTVPGGPDQSSGYPLLKNKPFFIVFAIADALSLTFSLTSVIIFLSILTSSFRLNDFRDSLHNKLLLGLTVLILSVSMMMVAFSATLILTISSGGSWTNIMLYIISFFPVTVFVLSYVRLYRLLIESFDQKLKEVKEAVWPTPNVSQPQAQFTELVTRGGIYTNF